MPSSKSDLSQSADKHSLIPAGCVVLGSLKIDSFRGQAYLSEVSLRLTVVEYRFLLYLALRAGRAVAVRELLSRLWSCAEQNAATHALVRSCVKRLREKVELDPRHPRYILTVHGYGYVMPKEVP
jgi:DNA-binding response OmpR family regulator